MLFLRDVDFLSLHYTTMTKKRCPQNCLPLTLSTCLVHFFSWQLPLTGINVSLALKCVCALITFDFCSVLMNLVSVAHLHFVVVSQSDVQDKVYEERVSYKSVRTSSRLIWGLLQKWISNVTPRNTPSSLSILTVKVSETHPFLFKTSSPLEWSLLRDDKDDCS